ncbi:MAG: hypothetical protein ACRD5M_02105 [Candidatus Acidiferrales bacterium]
MRNEEFLIWSYFLVGLISLCLGFAAYFWLRRPAAGIFSTLKLAPWRNILRKSFLASFILMAMSGFMSVSYTACTGRQYNDIVSDRSYIITVNEHQISEALFSIVMVAFVWGLIIFMNLLVIRREEAKSGDAGKKRSADPSS